MNAFSSVPNLLCIFSYNIHPSIVNTSALWTWTPIFSPDQSFSLQLVNGYFCCYSLNTLSGLSNLPFPWSWLANMHKKVWEGHWKLGICAPPSLKQLSLTLLWRRHRNLPCHELLKAWDRIIKNCIQNRIEKLWRFLCKQNGECWLGGGRQS